MDRFLEYEFQTIEIDGQQISVIDQSQDRTGPPVVFIHGILMSPGFWPRVIHNTSLEDCRWISVGLPGHFPGSVPEGFNRSDVTESTFSSYLPKVLDRFFEGEPAHLVGWSTGAFASLMTAAEFPENVRSVVSVNGFARGNWNSILGLLQWLSRIRLASWMVPIGMKLAAASPRLYRLFQWLMTTKRITSSEFITWINESSYLDFRRHDKRVMRELLAGISQIDATKKLAKITAPVLILGGENDPVVPPQEAEHLHKNLSNSKLVQQADLGHLFYIEGRERTLSQIEKWIAP